MLCRVDVDELQHALGGVVLESAYLERTLRAAFSALVGSKYTAVVDGRLTASALIEDCERLTRYHTSIPAPAKEAVLAALRACHEANRVIHDTWATRPGNVMVTLQGAQGSHEVTVTVRTLAEVRQLTGQLAGAADALRAAMSTALGSGWVLVEDQLRQELGHDITADPGTRQDCPGVPPLAAAEELTSSRGFAEVPHDASEPTSRRGTPTGARSRIPHDRYSVR